MNVKKKKSEFKVENKKRYETPSVKKMGGLNQVTKAFPGGFAADTNFGANGSDTPPVS